MMCNWIQVRFPNRYGIILLDDVLDGFDDVLDGFDDVLDGFDDVLDGFDDVLDGCIRKLLL
jgi:hypothetical protein